MMKLDFQFENDTSGPSGFNPDLWTDECKLGAFEGIQTIVINQIDFSNSLPILGFARFLKVAAEKFSGSKVTDEFEYNDLSSPWILSFKLFGDYIQVSDFRGESSVTKQEFIDACSEYSDRVFNECTKLCPEILDNEFVVEWWNNAEYSPATYEPRKTDRRTLTPTNPFFIS